MTQGYAATSNHRQGRVLLFLGRSLLAGLLALSVGCSAQARPGQLRPSTPAPRSRPATSPPSELQDADFYFQEDAYTARDDLSALGAQQSSLPFDMLDLQNDYGSLQVDLLSLQADLSLNNPNDACDVASQGLTDRNALFGDQTAYGQDVSLATSYIGDLDRDSEDLSKGFRHLRHVPGASGSAVLRKARAEEISILARIKAAGKRMNSTIDKDNPRVRNWAVRGAAVYRKLHRACSAVR